MDSYICIFNRRFSAIDVVDWLLVAEKSKCQDDSEIDIETVSTLQECARVCKGISSMFAFGTNDFEGDQCTSEGCKCLCEVSASKHGECTLLESLGYRLYRYVAKGTIFMTLCRFSNLKKYHSIIVYYK